jgi:integration host factor subunit alpha
MTVTKDSLVDSVCNLTEFNKKSSKYLVGSILDIIKSTLASGEDVLISGFGKFIVKNKRQRRGRNPATGDDLMLDQRRVVTFSCSNILRDKINDDRTK